MANSIFNTYIFKNNLNEDMTFTLNITLQKGLRSLFKIKSYGCYGSELVSLKTDWNIKLFLY